MKNKFLLLILSALFTGCQTHSTEAEAQEISLPAEPVNAVVQAAAPGENDEYLDWHSTRINGKLPLYTTVSRIHELLGKPDSVNAHHPDSCPSYFSNEDSDLSFYGGYHFEQSKDAVYFLRVDFRENKKEFLQINDLRLSAATTLEELKKYFPKAIKDIGKMNLYDIGEVDAISLPPSKVPADGSFILMFRNGKLIRVDNWSPC